MINFLINNLKKVLFLFLLIFLLLLGVAYYNTHKDLPVGVNYLSEEYAVNEDEVQFLNDLTYVNDEEEIIREQVIFDRIFGYIDEAKEYILLDMFLFNDYGAKTDSAYRDLSSELTDKLVNKKNDLPEIKIDFITDPINTVYGGGKSKQIEKLKLSGVNVIITDLSALRDSNFMYSAVWRTFFKFAGNSEGGFIRHPFASHEDKVSLRSYLRLLNFKANHRKVFVADNNDDFVSLVTSANPHDGSSGHSNVALSVRGDLAKAVYYTEAKVAEMSGGRLSDFPEKEKMSSPENEDIEKKIKLRLLTERKIKETILAEINRANQDYEIKIAMFYLADRDIVKALLKASEREAKIRLVLDPNKDAFGYEKNGIPNRQTAEELVKKSAGRIEIRWYNTHGEQFHTKMFISKSQDNLKLILGSANYTRRNLDNFNLELNVSAEMPADSNLAEKIIAYFDKIWENQDASYTVDYGQYQSSSKFKTLLYRVQEASGLSSF